jgi:hypothetical protein
MGHVSVILDPVYETPSFVYQRYDQATASGNQLAFLRCNHLTCVAGSDGNSSWAAPTFRILDTVSLSGTYSSVALGGSQGLWPVISYYDSTNSALKVVALQGQSGGSEGNPTTVLDSGGDVGRYTSIAVRSNYYPVIAYYDTTNGNLKVAECTDIICTNATIKTIGTADPAGIAIAIGNDGIPIVAYIDNNDLKVAVVPVT